MDSGLEYGRWKALPIFHYLKQLYLTFKWTGHFLYHAVNSNLSWNGCSSISIVSVWHDDIIKWKHFPHYWPFVRGIHQSLVNSQHEGHWRGALVFSLICVWINDWVNNREAGDLRHYRTHYDIIVMMDAEGNMMKHQGISSNNVDQHLINLPAISNC